MLLPSIPNPPSRSREPISSAVLILAILVIISFSPVLVAGYVRLDDYDNILRNPNVQSFSLSGLEEIWTGSRLGFYIPVTYSIWWLYAGIASILGKLSHSAPLFHALNLTLHILNATLVLFLYRTLLRLSNNGLQAHKHLRTAAVVLIPGVIFATHPVQVETVAWITELKGLMAGSLGLLGIWSYYHSPRKSLAAGLFLAAMLSKPSAIVLPGIPLIVDRILLGKTMKDSMKWPLVFWVPLLPFVFLTKHLQPDLNMEYVPGIIGRIIVAADAFSFYCRKLVFPTGLALDYGRSPYEVLQHVPAWHLALSFLLLVSGVAATLYSLMRPPRAVGAVAWISLVKCGWAICCLTLLPVLGLVPFAFQDFTTVADHYLYLPLFGVSLMVMGVLVRLEASISSLSLSACIVIAFTMLSRTQASKWRSTETLFSHTLAINPQSYVAHYSIATELLDRGKTDEGILHLRQCLHIRPDYLSAQVAIGIAWMRQERYQEAIEYYGSVLDKKPSSAGKRAVFMAMLRNNFGSALCNVGREKEGAQQFEKAAELDPSSITAHVNLGRYALSEGRFSDAAAHYQAALNLRPGDREIQRLLDLSRSKIR